MRLWGFFTRARIGQLLTMCALLALFASSRVDASPIPLLALPRIDIGAFALACAGGICNREDDKGFHNVLLPADFNGTFGTLPSNAPPGVYPNPVPLVANAAGAGMGAHAHAIGSVSRGFITGEVDAAVGGDGPLASADFQGIWQDSLQVRSMSLAMGTPVDLLVTLIVQGDLGCSGPLPGRGAPNVSLLGALKVGPGSLVDQTVQCVGQLFHRDQTIVHVLVGDVLALELQFIIDANTGGGPNGFSMVDPPASGMFIDSLTPGASYITGSQGTYETPAAAAVPEPASLVLVGCGLGWAFRRRKSQTTTRA